MSEINNISVEQSANDATARLQRALALTPDDNKENSDYLEGYKKGFEHGAQWQKEQTKVKRVWLNLVTGEYSNSWEKEAFTEPSETMLELATKNKWKLIEYTCINDPDFELYNQMKLR